MERLKGLVYSMLVALLVTSTIHVSWRAGMMIGSTLWGQVSDAYGRRVAYFCVAVFTFSVGVFSSVAPTYGRSGSYCSA